MFRCAAESKAMNHDTRRSREEATGTPKARQTGVVPSIILINAVSIIVIALRSSSFTPIRDSRTTRHPS